MPVAVGCIRSRTVSLPPTSAEPSTSLRAPLWRTSRLTLARKLAAVGCAFLLLALATVGLSMWVTWQLEGGAAAINEAGRMRMRSYQLALQVRDLQPGDAQAVTVVRTRMAQLDDSLRLLETGDPQRPLALPGGDEVAGRLADVGSGWRQLQAQVQSLMARPQAGAHLQIEPFVDDVDRLVSAIEQRLEARTLALHTFEMVMIFLAVVSALAILYASHVMVLDPVARLRNAVLRVEQGDFAARVKPVADDELGELAEGFNRMTERLATLYGGLEAKVREKTARLESEQSRLRALYDVSTFVASADNLNELAQGFARQMRRIAQADAVAVRWSDEANQRYMLLASDSLPQVLVQGEQCVIAGDCHCGVRPEPGQLPRMQVISLMPAPPLPSDREGFVRTCQQEGYLTLVTLPLTLQHRVLGEIELFYRGEARFGAEDRSLFEALASHLAGAMESLRMAALARESAVASERKLLAQELHDSIAQSLAFLKIQMALLRSAMGSGNQDDVQAVMGELDAGIKESYNDVRELLLHFRVRTDSERLDLALRETLSKFELQSGLRWHLDYDEQAMPLPADVQIQVLHIVQEALSNVRKHARASQVWLRTQARPAWQICVRDDGHGFAADAAPPNGTHVGLSIMRERAERIGAKLDVTSGPQGTEVRLTLPVAVAQPRSPAAA